MITLSNNAKTWQQSGIRSATQKCTEVGGINLGQGICDLPTPQLVKDAVQNVLNQNFTKYSACEGVMELRKAVAKKVSDFNQIPTQASQVLVSHGSTGAFVCAVQTVFNPGDEVILFEPFYGYHKKILELFGMSTKSTPIDLKDYSLNLAHLESIISKKTRGIVICTPCNPCGKVFTRDELLQIGALAEKHNLTVITDEIYEYITYPGHEHVSFASLKDFKKRTVTISGFSKTYNMTGWRLGYAVADAAVIEKMGLIQDLLYVCPATPLQHAALKAFELQQRYFTEMKSLYLQKRDFVVNALQNLGFKVATPQGAYYIMADISDLGFSDDKDAFTKLLNDGKVATVTGSSFYADPNDGKKYLRFCYALDQEMLETAMQNLGRIL